MKKKSLILSITALLALVSLTNCSAPTCPECPECPQCEECPDDKPDDKPTPDPDDKPTPEPEIDPSEGLIDPSESEWNETLTDLMVSYLGGGILPLIDLGEGELDAEFIKNDEEENFKSYLKITGGNFLVSRLESAVKDYKEHYWDALMVGESFYASNDLLKVEVEVTRNYNDLFELKAFYNEPFNPEDASAWNETTLTLIKERFGRFEVPFVYLGTKNYDSTITEDGSLLISGGTWNDSVISQFESSLKNWEITKDVENLTTRYATFKDGENTLNATLLKEHNKAELTVSITEAFDSTNQTSWSSEVTKAMDKSLNKTILPYVYLGTIYPTIDLTGTNERSLTLTGKFWDDSILANAKEAFQKDNTWSISDTETGVSFTKQNEFDSYEVIIEKTEAGIPVLRATRTEVYNETSLTDYTEELKTSFKDKYDEEMNTIPFLYLGTAYPTLNTEIPAKYEEDVNKLVITGGKYDARILENFGKKFTKENGWFTEIENVQEDTGSRYDENDGKVLAVALKNTGQFTYKVGLFVLLEAGEETAYLEINRSTNTGTKATEWSQESLSNVEKALGKGVKIPHFDTGRDTLEFTFDDYGYLEIQFVADHTNFSYRVWSAINAFTKDNWEVIIAHNDTYYNREAWISQISATKEFDGKKVNVTITINPSSYYRFAMFGSLSINEKYDPTKVVGTWDEAITTEIKNRYKIDLPFIYLGTDNPYLFEDTRDECLKIIGNALTKDLYTNARKVLTENGFLIDTSESSDMSVYATKENSDGNIVTVEVDYSDGRPYIALFLTEVFKPGTETSWDNKTQEVLTSELPTGVELPYLYLGTSEPTTTAETTDNGKKITIIGGNWDDAVLNLTKTTLQNESFNVSISSDTLVAHQLLENEKAKALRIRLSENWDDQIQLDVFVDEKPETVVEGFETWNDFPSDYSGRKPQDVMTSNLGTLIPEFIPKALALTQNDSISFSTPYTQFSNLYMGLSSYSSFYSPYYLYVAMEKLESLGFEVTYDPFSTKDLAGFSAWKNDSEGTLIITFGPANGYFEDTNNGLRLSAVYLQNETQFDSITEFGESDRNIIQASLDGLNLPYANLGSKTQKVSGENGEVIITGYNYSESIIENIKKTYSEAGWTINDTFVINNGHHYKTINGYLQKDGHTYVLTVTPTISKAVYGKGSLSSSSITTEVKVTMA